MKKLLTILTVLILSALVIVSSTIYDHKFSETFNFNLPENAKIEERDYSIFNDTLFMKILIDSESVDSFEDELLNNMVMLNYYEIEQLNTIPDFKNCCDWWDMNTQDVYIAYHSFSTGKNKKTVETYVFLVKNNEQTYFYVAKI